MEVTKEPQSTAKDLTKISSRSVKLKKDQDMKLKTDITKKPKLTSEHKIKEDPSKKIDNKLSKTISKPKKSKQYTKKIAKSCINSISINKDDQEGLMKPNEELNKNNNKVSKEQMGDNTASSKLSVTAQPDNSNEHYKKNRSAAKKSLKNQLNKLNDTDIKEMSVHNNTSPLPRFGITRNSTRLANTLKQQNNKTKSEGDHNQPVPRSMTVNRKRIKQKNETISDTPMLVSSTNPTEQTIKQSELDSIDTKLSPDQFSCKESNNQNTLTDLQPKRKRIYKKKQQERMLPSISNSETYHTNEGITSKSIDNNRNLSNIFEESSSLRKGTSSSENQIQRVKVRKNSGDKNMHQMEAETKQIPKNLLNTFKIFVKGRSSHETEAKPFEKLDTSRKFLDNSVVDQDEMGSSACPTEDKRLQISTNGTRKIREQREKPKFIFATKETIWQRRAMLAHMSRSTSRNQNKNKDNLSSKEDNNSNSKLNTCDLNAIDEDLPPSNKRRKYSNKIKTSDDNGKHQINSTKGTAPTNIFDNHLEHNSRKNMAMNKLMLSKRKSCTSNKFDLLSSSNIKQSSNLPTFKQVDLPMIKLFQNNDNTQSRQFGFVSNSAVLANINVSHSTCSSKTSAGEVFTGIARNSDNGWSNMYQLNDSITFKTKSDDPLFVGAQLQIKKEPTLPFSSIYSNLEQKLFTDGKSTTQKKESEKKVFKEASDKFSDQNGEQCETAKSQKICNFKVPTLPPAKRPPNRSKTVSSRSSSTSSSNSSTLEVQAPAPRNSEEDAISIYTEMDIEMSLERKFSMDLNNSELKQPKKSSVKSPKDKCVREISGNHASVPQAKELNHPNFQQGKTQLQPPSPSRDVVNSDIAQWTTTGNYKGIKKRIETPNIFKKLCYFHFTFECTYAAPNCRRSHIVKPFMLAGLSKLGVEDLLTTYEWVKDRHKLYIEIFDNIIECITKFPAEFPLKLIIDDTRFFENFEDRLPYVKKIIETLVAQGQAYNEVIYDIAFMDSKNTPLMTMLLSIACKYASVLIGDWGLIKRLFKYSYFESVPYKTIQELIDQCINIKDSDLCKNVMHDIVMHYKIELNALSIPSIQSFQQLLHSFKLFTEENNFKEMLKKFNIITSSVSDYNLDSSGENICIASSNTGVKRSISENYNCNYTEQASNKNAGNQDSNKNAGKRPILVPLDSLKPPSASSQRPNTRNIPDNCYTEQFNHNLSNQPLKVISPILSSESQSFSRSDNCKAISSSLMTNKPLLAFCSSFKSVSESSSAFSPISMKNILPESACNNPANTKHSIHSKSTSPSFMENPYQPAIQTSASSMTNSDRIMLNRHTSNGYLEYIGSEKPLSAEEVIALKDIIIKRGSHEDFITMLNKYKNTVYSNSFVLNAICLFKKNESSQNSYFFIKIIKEIGLSYIQERELKIIMRKLCVNILGVLESQSAFVDAANILAMFYEDIHGLIETEWLSTHKRSYSPVGKYLYFCGIFTKGRQYKLAYRLLTAPELKLLQGPKSWTLQNHKEADTAHWNQVLKNFIVATIENDIRIAMEVLLHILTENKQNFEINAWKHFNSLICRMVDASSDYLPELLTILPNILEGWHRHLSKRVLRGLVIALAGNLPLNDLKCLYNKCCTRNIYPKIKGDKNTIHLTTEFTCEEIHVIFRLYLYKIMKKRIPINELVFKLHIKDRDGESPQIIAAGNGLIKNLKARVCTVLAKSFDHIINVSSYDDDDRFIKIEREEMRTFLQKNDKRDTNELLSMHNP